jgi:hypothetical protein
MPKITSQPIISIELGLEKGRLKMNRNIVFRVIAAVILLAVIAGITGFAYTAGMAHQAAMSPSTAAITGGANPQPVPGYVYPNAGPFFHPFFGFGFLGFLVPLFLFFMVFGVVRMLIWGPCWGGYHMRHMRDARWGDTGPEGDFVPPMFAEWHKRAHAGQGNPEDSAPQK